MFHHGQVECHDKCIDWVTKGALTIEHVGLLSLLTGSGNAVDSGLLFFSPTEKITFKNAPSPQEFNEGDDADIICDVVSSPPADIIWKHKGSKIQVAKDGKACAQFDVPMCGLPTARVMRFPPLTFFIFLFAFIYLPTFFHSSPHSLAPSLSAQPCLLVIQVF